HEWYAEWLDNSRAVVVRLLRENPARAAHRIRLLILDADQGKLQTDSGEINWGGERLFVSPDKKMGLMIDDNRASRRPSGEIDRLIRNAEARTHVVSLETLKIVSSWRESDPDEPRWAEVAVNARWLADGQHAITVVRARKNDVFAPTVRLWD